MFVKRVRKAFVLQKGKVPLPSIRGFFLFFVLSVFLFFVPGLSQSETLKKTYHDPETGMEFVLVPGGCFEMGDVFGDGSKEEKPVHTVCVDDFYMARYEVTQAVWEKLMGNNPSCFKKGGNYPVDNVSWKQTMFFIEKLNLRTGKAYRLPTEAEWEYAARSGGKKEKWAGTSSEKSLQEYAWYRDNSGEIIHPVGEKKPNALGLYDMTGNVWEWCSDWYRIDSYQNSEKNNPQGPDRGIFKALRGGSIMYPAVHGRTTSRAGLWPSAEENQFFGFRLVLPVKNKIKATNQDRIFSALPDKREEK
jgi:sulfatase modifying factor 1